MKNEIQNEWLDSEITAIKCEKHRKNKKKYMDNVLYFKFFLMLATVFFWVPAIEASTTKTNHLKVMNAGRNFICNKCRTCQWQDNRNCDWAGNFYCSVCGHNLGK